MTPDDPTAPAGAPAPAAPPGTVPPRPAPPIPAAAVAPPKPTSNRTPVVVAAVVVLTLAAGGVGALVASVAGSKHTAADASAHSSQLTDQQQQQQKPRDHVAPPSTVPVAGPQPSQPVTTVAPSTTTTTAPVTPSDQGGKSIDLGHNISTTLPAGWTVDQQTAGGTSMSSSGAVMEVLFFSTQKGEGADSVLERRAREFATEVSQSQIGNVKVAKLPSARVIEAISGVGSGYLVRQSGGTIPVEALFYVYVRQDGLGVVVQTLCAKGSFAKHVADFQTIFNGVYATI
ncbi:MAG: hypothetical protein JWN46_2311 [Acidimicrobiales bacterium]|nr:hypothetical protein [Acidimicrobiales bacterium]